MLNRPKTSLDLQFVSLRGYTAVQAALYLCIFHVPPTLLSCLATLFAKLVGLKGFDIAIRFASLAETRVDAIVAALAELSLGPVDGVLGHIVAGIVAGHQEVVQGTFGILDRSAANVCVVVLCHQGKVADRSNLGEGKEVVRETSILS